MTRRRSRSARRTTTVSEVSTMPPYRFLWNVSIVFYVYGKHFRGRGERENYNYSVDCCGIRDPDRDPSLNGHAGFNDSILERTYGNMQCKDLIGDFLWWMMTRPEGTARLHVGVYCVRGRHWSTAMAWFAEQVEEDTRAYERKGEYTNALAELCLALKQEPSHVSSLITQGLIHMQMKELEQAETSYRKALAVEKNHALALVRLGYCKLLAADLQEAIHLFQRALQQRCGTVALPRSVKGSARIYMALAMMGQQDIDGALYQLAEARKNHRNFESLCSSGKDSIVKGECEGLVGKLRSMSDLDVTLAQAWQLVELMAKELEMGLRDPSAGKGSSPESGQSPTREQFTASSPESQAKKVKGEAASSPVTDRRAWATSGTEAAGPGPERRAWISTTDAKDARSTGQLDQGGKILLAKHEMIDFAKLTQKDCLGSGGFGAVYRGIFETREVAIKKLFCEDGGNISPLQLEELEKEVVALRSLSHPRLVGFIGACLQPPNLCIVTEIHGQAAVVSEITTCEHEGRNAKSALHRAALRGRAEMISLFLREEAPVDVLDEQGNTPLSGPSGPSGTCLRPDKKLLRAVGEGVTFAQEMAVTNSWDEQSIADGKALIRMLEAEQVPLDNLPAEPPAASHPLPEKVRSFGHVDPEVSLPVDKPASPREEPEVCLQALVKQADLGSVKRWLRCKSQQLPLPGECDTKHREAKGIKASESPVLAHAICTLLPRTAESALFAAVGSCEFSETGEDIRVAQPRAESALHLAALHGHTDILMLLLETRINPNVTNDQGRGRLPVPPSAADRMVTIFFDASKNAASAAKIFSKGISSVFCHACTRFMPGGSLHHLLHKARTPLTLGTQSKIAIQVCEGVDFLHGHAPPVVHRDLKSLNIVLDRIYNAKICDFGLTQSMEKTHITLKEGGNGGSPRYMAPECYDCKGKITEKVDVWALGCILVEVFGGPLPYDDCSNIQQIVAKVLIDKQLPYIPHHLPAGVRPIVEDCFQFDFKQRASAQDAQATGVLPDEIAGIARIAPKSLPDGCGSRTRQVIVNDCAYSCIWLA
ncbi:hypothetical protein AK812_SmicGene24403 [Symbiodinium microadriaticum]|uniref:Protein kinase domain-containing protein n=1 Tax=Symbiodinium microadriaticum TaxID=2951 RepID=A0A1Q9DEQ3_SYMMI|nr:hypothetical protein AK812_SmicGene24403 [Symbiodinium microadriaticum]